ncbi:hypothetical protein AOLI_G00177080 [Acnodon oligacanthus]
MRERERERDRDREREREREREGEGEGEGRVEERRGRGWSLSARGAQTASTPLFTSIRGGALALRRLPAAPLPLCEQGSAGCALATGGETSHSWQKLVFLGEKLPSWTSRPLTGGEQIQTHPSTGSPLRRSSSVRRNSTVNSKAGSLTANHRIKDRDYLGWMDFGRRSAEEYEYSS